MDIVEKPQCQQLIILASILISLGITFFENYFEEFDLERKAFNNKNYAEKYWEMQEEAIWLLGKLQSGSDISEIEKDFYKLLIKRHYANNGLPYSSLEAVELASKKTKNNYDNICAEDYLYFIPKHLNEWENF